MYAGWIKYTNKLDDFFFWLLLLTSPVWHAGNPSSLKPINLCCNFIGPTTGTFWMHTVLQSPGGGAIGWPLINLVMRVLSQWFFFYFYQFSVRFLESSLPIYIGVFPKCCHENVRILMVNTPALIVTLYYMKYIRVAAPFRFKILPTSLWRWCKQR